MNITKNLPRDESRVETQTWGLMLGIRGLSPPSTAKSCVVILAIYRDSKYGSTVIKIGPEAANLENTAVPSPENQRRGATREAHHAPHPRNNESVLRCGELRRKLTWFIYVELFNRPQHQFYY